MSSMFSYGVARDGYGPILNWQVEYSHDLGSKLSIGVKTLLMSGRSGTIKQQKIENVSLIASQAKCTTKSSF